MQNPKTSTVAKRRRKKRRPQTNQSGWTTVKPKPKCIFVTIEVPEEVLSELRPLERSVYDLLATSKLPLTAPDIMEMVEDNCSRADIGNVLYDGLMQDYVEAADWKSRPRQWRLKVLKMKN